MPGIAWEKRPENRGKVENFKKCYQDREIPVSLIASEFGLEPATVSGIACRLGLPFRKPRHAKDDAPQVTLEAIDSEEQELKRRLFELQQKRANMVVQVIRQEVNGKPIVTIQGLALDEDGQPTPVYTTPAMVQNFLDGQGAGKLRDAVGRKS